MPTYEFECELCGYFFEKFLPVESRNLKECPRCKGKNALTRLISNGNGPPIFKGTGFYETDYKRGKK